MERLLVNTSVSNQTIIEAHKTEDNNGYIIKYKCEKCGNVREKRFNTDRQSCLRCYTCNYRGYIVPITLDDKLVGFDTYTASEWAKKLKLLRDIRGLSLEGEGDII